MTAGERRRVVVDTDTGIDDAIALFYLAARRDVEIVAVGSVHGNCAVDHAAANALRVLEVCGLEDVPVALGSERPIEQDLRLAPYVHGRDGLGDVGLPAAHRDVSGEHAVAQLLRLSREREGQLDLLVLGPMTNIGMALCDDPDLLARFRSVVLMGGSGPFPPAGVLREVDANVHNDKLAAKLVFSAPRTLLVMVGVNVCTRTVLEEDAIAQISGAVTPQAAFVSQILPFYLDFYRYKWGRRISPQYDALAAAVLADPSYMTAYVDGPVNVLDDGAIGRAWLMAREDGGELALLAAHVPPTRVALAVDGDRFHRELVNALISPLPAASAWASR